MLAAAALLAMYADWVPVRWSSSDPKSLELVANTPVNCLLLEREHWSKEFVAEAAGRGIVTLGVIHPSGNEFQDAATVKTLGMSGAVMEGIFDDSAVDLARRTVGMGRLPLIVMTTRSHLNLDSDAPILATNQGVWPGIHLDEKTGIAAGPTSAPWIDTNTGFLRFARASTDAVIWMGNRPPPDAKLPVRSYLRAVGDAWMNGARWVVALDEDFMRRLLAHEPAALKDWALIAVNIRHFEEHREWRGLETRSKLALIEDYPSGAEVTGGLLDMIAVKHLPVRAIPARKLGASEMRGVTIAVNVSPELPPEQKQLLKSFTDSGGKLIAPPAEWRLQSVKADEFMLDVADADRLDALWKQVSALTGRQNLSVRLFNVASTLSNALQTAGQRQIVVHLLNFSDYPIQNVTVHVTGVYQHARIYRPEYAPEDVVPYRNPDGTGLDVDQRIYSVATIVLE